MKKLIVILGLVMILMNGISADQADDEGKHKVSTAYDTGSRLLSNYWERAKVSVEKLQEYFFPPNIDFRSSEAHERVEEGGAGGKVKEAVTKSLETSKSTLEESAKLASETVSETADKVKRSLSDKLHQDHHHPQQSAEL